MCRTRVFQNLNACAVVQRPERPMTLVNTGATHIPQFPRLPSPAAAPTPLSILAALPVPTLLPTGARDPTPTPAPLAAIIFESADEDTPAPLTADTPAPPSTPAPLSADTSTAEETPAPTAGSTSDSAGKPLHLLDYIDCRTWSESPPICYTSR